MSALTQADEEFHAPGPEEQWSDSLYFGERDPQRGRTVELEGEAFSVAPLRRRRDGRLTHVDEGLTRMRWEGRETLAISEYLVQRAEAAVA
jgi:hypothetical protein